MTIPANQLAFMASMAPGCGLGSLIIATNCFLGLHPDDGRESLDSAAGALWEGCMAVPGMKDVYNTTVKPMLPTAGFRDTQRVFRDSAAPVLGTNIRDLAARMAGVPIFRPKGEVVSRGLRARELRRLMDAGAVSSEDVRRLVATIEKNLEENIRKIVQVERGGSSLYIMASGVMFALSSAISFGFLYRDPSLFLSLLGIAPFAAGVFFGFQQAGCPPSDIRKAMGMNILNYAGMIRRRRKEMERLLAEYRREFDHPDWTRVRSAAGAFPPPVMGANQRRGPRHAGEWPVFRAAADPAFPPSPVGANALRGRPPQHAGPIRLHRSDDADTSSGGESDAGVVPLPNSPAAADTSPASTTKHLSPPPPALSITEETGDTFSPREDAPPAAGLAGLDRLEDQIAVKEWMRKIAAGVRVDAMRQKNKLPPVTQLAAAFMGVEGAGRETFARAYAGALAEAGRFAGAPKVVVIDARSVQSDRAMPAYERLEYEIHAVVGGNTVVVICNAGSFAQSTLPAGIVLPQSGQPDPVAVLVRAIKDESHRRAEFVLIDEAKAMEQLFKSAPELARLIPAKNRLRFEEYDAPQLLRLMEKFARGEGYRLSDEARQKALSRLKGRRGSALVAREILEEARTRQSLRLDAVSKAGREINEQDLRSLVAADFAKETGAGKSAAMERLNRMTGLAGVKKAIAGVANLLETNKMKEEAGMATKMPALNAIFRGPQGTGKTTTAEIYAEILREFGFLLKGHLVKTNAAELVGDVVGAAERNTLAKFAEARGGILFIDEAHTLPDSPFGRKVLETLVPLMENHRDDTIVILGGYKGKIEKLFDVDQGLRERFSLIIDFDEYLDTELGEIFAGKVQEAGLEMNEGVSAAAQGIISRRRSERDFAYARTVRNIFEAAVTRQSERISKQVEEGGRPSGDDLRSLTVEDVAGPDAPEPLDIRAVLDKYVGFEGVREAMEEWIALIEMERKRGKDPRKKFEPGFALAGPTGTGKSSLAGDLGKIFQSLGFIPGNEVVKVNAVEIVAGYQGQTAGKVREILEKSLGKVLFIDEIGGLVRMAGQYASEAVEVLNQFLEANRGRFALVIGGYESDVNAFLAMNEGLPRRIPNRLRLKPFTTDHAITLFERWMAEDDFILSQGALATLRAQMERLINAPNWSSGGDVRTLVNTVARKQAVLLLRNRDANPNNISAEAIEMAVGEMVEKKLAESANGRARRRSVAADSPSAAAADAMTAAPTTIHAERAREAARSEGVGIAEDKRMAIVASAETIAQELNLDPATFIRDAENPASELVRRLAEATGATPEEVTATLRAIAAAIASQPKQKGFICMHCGNSNPECPYKVLPPAEREKHNAWQG